MTPQEFRKLHDREPFAPFDIHLAGGRSLHVHGREYLVIPKTGRTVRVYQLDHTLNIVDLMLVTDLELRPDAESETAGTGES